MVILVVGAHPDDIELGLGATIHQFRQRYSFHGLVLTSGDLRAPPEAREKATDKAARILGYEPHFGHLPDSAFTDVEAERIIRDKISELRPDVAIGHPPQESHRDHMVAHIATLSASRRVPTVLHFEGPYSRGFRPQLYVPVEEASLSAKIRALKEHASVLEPREYLKATAIKASAKIRGIVVSTIYAESFSVERIFGGLF